MKSSTAKTSDRNIRDLRMVQQVKKPTAVKPVTRKSQPSAKVLGKRQVTRTGLPDKTTMGKTRSLFRFKKKLFERGENLYVEFRATLRVALFILGIWSHHFLIRKLFGSEQPAILSTMIPGVEWMLLGMLLRDMIIGPSRSAR